MSKNIPEDLLESWLLQVPSAELAPTPTQRLLRSRPFGQEHSCADRGIPAIPFHFPTGPGVFEQVTPLSWSSFPDFFLRRKKKKKEFPRDPAIKVNRIVRSFNMSYVNIAAIYRNPVIPTGHYFVKLTKLFEQDKEQARPLIQVVFRIPDIYGRLSGVEVACNIHPSPQADPIFDAFLESFAFGKNGKPGRQYARVLIKPTSYKNTDYSAITFIRQRQADIQRSLQLERIDRRAAAAAEERARKQAEKEAYESVHGKRGRGRPRKATGTEGGADRGWCCGNAGDRRLTSLVSHS